MGIENKSERTTQTKLSVALIAHKGNWCDYTDTQILLVKNRYGLMAPPSGSIEVLNTKPEHPLVAMKREWKEETDGENFKFAKAPKLEQTIFAQSQDHLSIGFIYYAPLTEEMSDRLERGKEIRGDEKIVHLGLYDIDQILAILRDWKNQLAYPETNAQTLINIVNNVMTNHGDLFMPGVEDLFTFNDFGMKFEVTIL